MIAGIRRGPVPSRGYADLHDHVERLDEAGLLYRIDAPVNKDTEMHPLVRWQFRGGIAEKDRKAFLFTHVVDGKGRRYDIPVLIGAYAANRDIYRIGMNVERLEDIGAAWEHAVAHPIPPRLVERGCVHDIVVSGDRLRTSGQGLESLPVPVSTPGFDAAPYLTMTGVITRDPDTRIQNLATYRCQLKGPSRLGLMTLMNLRSGGYAHWAKFAQRKERMPIAIVLGSPPLVAVQGPQKLPLGVDELAIAGGLAGVPINVVKAKTVDLLVPAEAEIVIEGLVDPEYLEPEGPFGESHGYVALEDYNMVIDVTAITRRKDAILPSIISQVTPSESSMVKKLAYEPMYLAYLRDTLAIKGIKRVVLHEPLTNLRRFIFLQFERDAPKTEVWRALYGTLNLQAAIGKFVIAVNDDIDPENADAVFWAMAYRCNPIEDTHVVPYREMGHAPRMTQEPELESALLVDATLKYPMPPLSLPKKEHMENAKVLWERLGLPPLKPESPWYGYSLGEWTEEWERSAKQAARGDWIERDESYRQRRRAGIAPNTPAHIVEGEDEA
jgi:4-hydroxy-3-polyprenylbenzoate decarboxylase